MKNATLTPQQMRFYAGPAWEEFQRKADELAHKYGGNRHVNESERFEFIEQANYLRGSIEAAQAIVPHFHLRYRAWMEGALAHLLSSIHRLETIPTVSAEERGEVLREALGIVGLMDAGDEELVERNIRTLEQRVEQMAVDGVNRDVEGRLAGLRNLIDAAA